MHHHDSAERLVKEHPVILDLERRLKADQLSGSVEFLTNHIFFAYPRTLWIKWDVDVSAASAMREIGQRHSLNPQKTGRFLSKWLAYKRAIKNIVFDFTDVTIFDADTMQGLFLATTADDDGRKYYVCSGEIADRVRGVPQVEADAIFPTEKALLTHLREVPKEQRCVVRLPAAVDLMSLDKALQEHASKDKIQNCDAVAFDFTSVTSISFEAHCMLSPVIHSLAHHYGILATAQGVSRKILKDIGHHGSLRPMRSNLINVPQSYLRRTEPPELKGNPVGVYTFTPDIQDFDDFWMYRLNTIFRYYVSWFSDIDTPAPGRNREKDRMFGSSLQWLQTILGELVANVKLHAHGVGYLAVELNPEPGKGLDLYVGDTGIGLPSGLQRSYKFKKKPTDKEAVCMAMSLGEKFAQRRRLPGTLAFGGRGLEFIGFLLRRLNGTITVRTGESMASFSSAKNKGRRATKVDSDMHPIQGTHVYIHIPSKWKAI